MKINKSKIILGLLIFSFVILGHQALASTTNGTIDSTYRYGWGENVGFIDFGSEAGNVHITDDGLTGYAYGENIGWINLSTVTNDKEGNLSGYAWGENIGFIDFSQVAIDNHGYFTGSAYGENIGFITFNKDNTNNVLTDWRPKSTRGSTSGGSSVESIIKFQEDQVEKAKEANIDTAPYIQALNSTISSTKNTTPNITRTLKYGMIGEDVKELQKYLNTHGYPLVTEGAGLPAQAGSLNHETTYFGLKTKQAVIKFQLANKLIGDGIVGPLTRALLK